MCAESDFPDDLTITKIMAKNVLNSFIVFCDYCIVGSAIIQMRDNTDTAHAAYQAEKNPVLSIQMYSLTSLSSYLHLKIILIYNIIIFGCNDSFARKFSHYKEAYTVKHAMTC